MQEGKQKEGFEVSQSILQGKTRDFEEMKRSVERFGGLGRSGCRSNQKRKEKLRI